MGECSAYGSLQADSKVKFSAWPASWRPPGADRFGPDEPQKLSRMAGAIDDSTINIVVVIIIIIIMHKWLAAQSLPPAQHHWLSATRCGSVIRRTSVCGWRTFTDLCLIYRLHVTTAWVKCPLWANNSAFHTSRVGK